MTLLIRVANPCRNRFPVGLRGALAASIAALLLGACAQFPVRTPDPTSQAEEADPQSAAQAEAPSRVEPLPNQPLTAQILYQLVMAEIAAQRGNSVLASSGYLDLARKTRDPRVARRAAEIAHFSRNNEAALEAIRLWLEFDPESPQARYMLVGLLAQANRFDEMQPHVIAILEQESPESRGEALMRLGRVFSRNPDRQAVLRGVDRMTEPYLNLAEARLLRAQAANGAGDPARAMAEVEVAMALKPEWDQPVLFKAQMQQKDAPAAALETIRQYLVRYPKARDVRLQYARALVGEKRYEEGREQFRRLLADFPDNQDVIFAVGALSYQLNDYPVADSSFRKLLDLGYADSGTVRIYLGQIAENQKRPDDAIVWYAGVPPGEQHLTAQIRLAHVLSQQGKLDEARRHLQQTSASSTRERVQLTLAEAQLLREAGRNADAFDVLDRSLREYPDQPDLLYESALIAEKLGHTDVLEKNLRRLIQIKPDHAHAYNALGYSLAERGERLDEAYSLIASALKLAPDDPFILDSMGWVLYRKGELQAALNHLSRAFGLRPDPEIAAHLGEVLWMMGRRDDAAKTWREAAKADPGNDVLSAAIKRFLP